MCIYMYNHGGGGGDTHLGYGILGVKHFGIWNIGTPETPPPPPPTQSCINKIVPLVVLLHTSAGIDIYLQRHMKFSFITQLQLVQLLECESEFCRVHDRKGSNLRRSILSFLLFNVIHKSFDVNRTSKNS